jgi:outer membrane lipoprotein-sorting protein
MKFHLPAIAVIAALAASPALALNERDQQDVTRLEGHINAVRTFKANFRQIAPSGAVATGTIYMSRPGRLRVEYNPPVKMRIFATPQWLIVEDCKVKEPQYLPLRSTPAGILIQPSIRLSGDIQVVDVLREGRWITLRMVETKDPGKGSINLVFNVNPVQLVGWTVYDQRGQATQVTFDNIQTDTQIDPNLFGFISRC